MNNVSLAQQPAKPSGHPQAGVSLSFEALRPEYEDLWSKLNRKQDADTRAFTPVFDGLPREHLFAGITKPHEAMSQARAIMAPAAKARFQAVERATAVPWFVTGIVLTREAGSPPNFHAWLHNGDPMFDHHGNPRQTVDVPAHRPPNPAVSWEDGAVDAYAIEGLLNKKDWSPAFVAWLLEKFNGWGYRLYHRIPSPYVWGATVIQQRGKYTSDRVWDATVMDPQIGGMAILAALMQSDPEIRFP